jgi:hypothetical protein
MQLSDLTPSTASAASLSAPEQSVDQMRAEILQSGDYSHYLMTFDSPQRLPALLAITSRLTNQQYWELVREAWMSAEVTLPDRASWLSLLQSDRPGREHLMTEEEREALSCLPEVIRIFRGCGSHDGIGGLSWTLDRVRAKKFAFYACGPRRLVLTAEQHGSIPVVAEATVAKRYVIAHILDRQEEEIIVDPRNINLVEAREWLNLKR